MYGAAETPPAKFSWLKRIILALAAVALILIIAALLFGRPTPSETQATAPTDLSDASFLALTILAFIAGVLSFTSPCTLPILPAYFAFTFQSDRRRIALMTTAFFVGLALVFTLLGASASFVGGFLRQHLQTLTMLSGAVIILLGVMTLLDMGFSGPNFATNPSATLGGSFLFGLTFGFALTPCVGPILASILALAASAQTVLQGTVLLFIYALGLGLPLMLVSTFFGDRPRTSLFWRILRGKGWVVRVGRREFLLHTTNIISGLLFIGLGLLMVQGRTVQSLLPSSAQQWLVNLQFWVAGLEERVIAFFGG